MHQRYTWNKAEKLKSRKRIDQLFKRGKHFSLFPFKVFFVVTPVAPASAANAAPLPVPAQSPVANPAPVQSPAGVPAHVSRQFPTGVPTSAPVPSATSIPSSASIPPQAAAGIPIPVRVSSRAPTNGLAPVQAGFGAGSRHFKKAVDRNRIKRLCREAYRLQKQPLVDHLASRGLTLAVFFVYIGKDLPDFQTVTGKIGVILRKLVKETT